MVRCTTSSKNILLAEYEYIEMKEGLNQALASRQALRARCVTKFTKTTRPVRTVFYASRLSTMLALGYLFHLMNIHLGQPVPAFIGLPRSLSKG